MLHINFRKIEATDALKHHMEKRVKKFEKYVTYPMEVHALLSLEKPFQCAEITCYAEHRQLVAIAKTRNLYEAIDLAAQKMEGQLRRERERKKGHESAHLIARPTRVVKLAKDVGAELPHLEKKV